MKCKRFQRDTLIRMNNRKMKKFKLISRRVYHPLSIRKKLIRGKEV